jgi:hypothetical protein
MSWGFVLNLVIALFGVRAAWLDHGETYQEWKSLGPGKEKRQKLEKLIVLWGAPLLSVLLLPISWTTDREIEAIAQNVKTNDPLSRPLVAVSATAILRVKG